MDMSAAYREAVASTCPKARDRLRPLPRHQAVQREAVRPAPGAVPPGDRRSQKKVLKGTRWLLLKNPENLDPSKGENGGWRRPCG